MTNLLFNILTVVGVVGAIAAGFFGAQRLLHWLRGRYHIQIVPPYRSTDKFDDLKLHLSSDITDNVKALGDMRSAIRFLLRIHKLDSPNPYVPMPGFDNEIRCAHCLYPAETQQHDPACLWVETAIIRKKYGAGTQDKHK